MDVLDSLGRFGLTRQEAQLYLVLLAEGDLSGYEAAKQAGISRSNAYAGLVTLVEKGAAYLLDGAVPRYAALDPQEWFTHRIRSLSETAESLVPALPRRQSPNEGYLTVAGDQAILDRMKTMVENAKLRIYLSLPAAWLTPLVSALRSACSRGIRLTVLCDATLAPSFAGLPEVVIHPTVPPGGQIRLIVDSSEVLTGDGESGTPSCLYSRRPALVALFKQALGNEIRLLELGEAKTLD